jgi:membrane fusion protein (multidrug efflux system)
MHSRPQTSRAAFAAVLPFLISILLVGCGSDAQPELPQRPAPEVAVATLQPQALTISRELSGRVAPSKVAEVRPQVAGLVRELLFEEGSTVEAGQPLYRLEDAEYRASLSAARAGLARAEAALATARRNAQRGEELIGRRAISQQDYDNLQSTLQQAQADRLAARAEVERATVTLDRATLTAPISGRIGRSAVTAGALVTAGQGEPLAVIQQIDPVYVEVSQSSSEFLALRRDLAEGSVTADGDLPVPIALEDGSTHAQPGSLAFAEASVDPNTGSYSLRVVVPNPDALLLPGMYVRAEVGRGVRQQALLVPQRAIQRDPKGESFALVVGADGMVERRAVQLGGARGDAWLVESGLAAGEQVIVEGLQKARPGAAVRIAAPQIAQSGG